MKDIVDLCQQVIDILKNNYPDTQFGVEHDRDTDIYHIWYNKFQLKECKRFTDDAESLLDEKFLSNGIFNVFVAYFFKYDNDNQIVHSLNKHLVSIMSSEYLGSHDWMSSCRVLNNGENESYFDQFKFYDKQEEPMLMLENVQPTIVKKDCSDELLRSQKQEFPLRDEVLLSLFNVCYGKTVKNNGKNEDVKANANMYLGLAA